MAEIYQTDLVSEKTSEAKCYQSILSALEHDPLCLDAYVQFVNYFMNKGDLATAKKIAKKVMEEIHLQMDQDTIFEEEDSETETIPHSLRTNVAKLLIELEEWDEGLYILNGLYDEDNTNLDVVYMLAFVNFKMQKYSQTKDLLDILSEKDFQEDSELYTAFEELLAEFKKVNYDEQQDKSEDIEEEDPQEHDWMDLE